MRSRLAVAVALALACALPAATGDGQQPPPQAPTDQQRPTFRSDINFVRVDVSIAESEPSVSARLLDRKGQPLQVPVTAALRQEAGRRFAAAERALAPLVPADYLIELSIHRGQRVDKAIVPVRIVP